MRTVPSSLEKVIQSVLEHLGRYKVKAGADVVADMRGDEVLETL